MADRYRPAIVAAFVLLGGGAGVSAQPTSPLNSPEPLTVVRAVRFEGTRALEPRYLSLQLRTRASSCRLILLAPLCHVAPTIFLVKERYGDSSSVADDVTRLRVLYWQHGYRQARVSPSIERARDGIRVTFRIDEGPPTMLSSLSVVRRDSVLSARDVDRVMRLRPGTPVNILDLDSTLIALRDQLWDRGYPDARIDTTLPHPDAAGQVPMSLTISSGAQARVGRIVFSGNERLSDRTLRRGMTLRPGGVYRRGDVLETQRRLYDSPLLREALVVVPAAGVRGLGDSLKTVEVVVREAQPRRLRAAIGFNTVDFAQLAVDVADRDFTGGGRHLRLRGAVGNLLASPLNGRAIFRDVTPAALSDAEERPFLQPTWQASAELVQPWLLAPGGAAEVSAFTGRRIIPGVAIDRSTGAGAGLVYQLRPRMPIGLGYRLERTRVTAGDVYFCANYGVCDATAAGALRGSQRLAPLSLSARVDRTNALEIPTAGFDAGLDLEHADAFTGSTFRYTRVEAEGAAYRSLPLHHSTLAVHARLGRLQPGSGGAADGVVHPRKRFYAGGAESVRGYGENELGPRVLQVSRAALLAAGCTAASIATASCDPSGVPSTAFEPRPIGGTTLAEGTVEWRLPLNEQLTTVLFADGAYVGTAHTRSLAPGRRAITPGLGVRARSPLGLLRLDFGINTAGPERLPVVVADDSGGTAARVLRLATPARYDPLAGAHGTLGRIGRRIVVHFAMGQPF